MHVERPPAAWLLVQLDKADPDNESNTHSGTSSKSSPPNNVLLTLPVHAAAGLPDFAVSEDSFDAAKDAGWQPGDRFKVQVGGRKGTWHRGAVTAVHERLSSDADPWEALMVRCLICNNTACPYVFTGPSSRLNA